MRGKIPLFIAIDHALGNSGLDESGMGGYCSNRDWSIVQADLEHEDRVWVLTAPGLSRFLLVEIQAMASSEVFVVLNRVFG